MPPPDYADLNAHPSHMLAYMSNNLILTDNLTNSKYADTPEYLELIPAARYPGSNIFWSGTKDGSPVDVYSLVASDKTNKSEALLSYICDYKKNKIRYATLSDGAKFCFTIVMNGCTFGIGTPSPEGTVIVSHCNRAKAQEKQYEEQESRVLQGHGADKVMTMLNPGVYRTASQMSATTFGIRKSSGWKFYFQSWRPDHGVIKMYDVFEVPVNQFNG